LRFSLVALRCSCRCPQRQGFSDLPSVTTAATSLGNREPFLA
jgi:hypothetical protein